MKFELNITRRMQTKAQEFILQSRISCAEQALVLFGPSGSGKTLTLQAIAGLLTPDSGCIKINDRVLFDSSKKINIPARHRKTGYVFQNYALFPHLSVRENIAFGLKPALGPLSRKGRSRVSQLLEKLGLEKVAGHKPGSLSGGQQQRAALARALAPSPEILLLDEPFSALDQPLRLRMRRELSRVLELFNIPMIMVTHDTSEAEFFAQAVAVYREGRVIAVHSASEINSSAQGLMRVLNRQVSMAYA